jgi:site-specific DNA recombinase
MCFAKGCESYRKSIPRERVEGAFAELLKCMTPAPNLFRVARAMFRELWDGRLAHAAQTAASVKAEVSRLEKQTNQFLSRIVETQNEAVIAAYEKRIAELEQEKLVLLERASKAGAPQRGFEEMFELSMRFLASPWNIWESGQIDMRRLVLKLAFAERLGYVRNQGFRTPLLFSPFNMLSACEGGKSEMARPAGLEPATHGLEGRCSVRLSYGRMLVQFSLFHSIVGEIFSVAFWPDTPELWLLDPVP